MQNVNSHRTINKLTCKGSRERKLGGWSTQVSSSKANLRVCVTMCACVRAYTGVRVRCDIHV